jgi:hypothetical protein
MEKERIVLCVPKPHVSSQALQKCTGALAQINITVIVMPTDKYGTGSYSGPLVPFLWINDLEDLDRLADRARSLKKITADQLYVWWKFTQDLDSLLLRYRDEYGEDFLPDSPEVKLGPYGDWPKDGH